MPHPLQLLLYSISFVLTGTFFLQAQPIHVVNESTLGPAANVFVFNDARNYSCVTDEKGHCRLSNNLQPGDTIYFQHASYYTAVRTVADIAASGYKVTLAYRTVQLQNVEVSATRWDNRMEDVPAAIVPISQKAISFKNPQTTADALEQSGQVFVQRSQMAGGSPMLRGFAANSVLLSVDGVRMNNAIFRSGNLHNVIMLDPNIIDHAEVIFGPGSVLYGSDALGGVMSFHTQKPRLATDTTLFKVNTMARYATANHEKTGHFNINVGYKKWGFLTSITFSDFDHLRTGNIRPLDAYPEHGKRASYVDRIAGKDTVIPNPDPNLQRPSAYRQINGLQKVRYRPTDSLDFLYTFYYTTSSNAPRYDRHLQTRDGKPEFAKWYYGPQKWMMNHLQIKYNADNQLFDRMQVSLAHQQLEESRHDRRYGDAWLRSRQEAVNMWTLNADFRKALNGAHALFYGLEGVYNIVHSAASARHVESGEAQEVATRYPDGGSTLSMVAAYLRHQWKPTDKVTLTAGVRYTYTILESLFESKQFYDFPYDQLTLNTGAFNGSLGAVYRPGSDWQFALNASNGFRAPNVDDVSKVFDSEPGIVMVPNANLGPEYSYTADGYVQKTFSDMVTIRGTAYYSWLRDVIVRRDFLFQGQDTIMYDGIPSRVQANVNAGRGYVYGFSGQLQADLTAHLAFHSTLTYTEGRDEEGISLRHIPPFFGMSQLILHINRLQAALSVQYNGWRRFENLSPSEQHKTHLYTPEGAPPWYVLNARVAYQVWNRMQVNVALMNILDHHYRPFASGISAPGRNFIITMRGSF